jgi:hypothetical protein
MGASRLAVRQLLLRSIHSILLPASTSLFFLLRGALLRALLCATIFQPQLHVVSRLVLGRPRLHRLLVRRAPLSHKLATLGLGARFASHLLKALKKMGQAPASYFESAKLRHRFRVSLGLAGAGLFFAALFGCFRILRNARTAEREARRRGFESTRRPILGFGVMNVSTLLFVNPTGWRVLFW